MRTINPSLGSLVKRYKTALIIGVSALILLVIGSTALIGYAIVSFAAPAVQSQSATIVEEKSGFVKQVILGVAVGWIEENIAAAESASVVDGIACFSAIGGPAPQELLRQARQRIIDPMNIEKLDVLSSRIDAAVSQTTGPAACTSWILSG
jgi:hypothetical protein